MVKCKLGLTIVVCVVVSVCCLAQDKFKTAKEKPSVTKIVANTPSSYDWANQVNKDFAWILEPWTGDDSQNIQIKNEIDRLIVQAKKNGTLETIYNKYRIAAQKAPKDKSKLFAWAYAGYVIAFIDPIYVDPSLSKIPVAQRRDKGYVASSLGPLMNSISKASLPYTYEFMRIRFLLAVLEWPMVELAPLGKRLVEHNPHDYEVIYQARRTLDLKDIADRKLALKWVQVLVDEQPLVPKYYAARGAVYMGIFPITKDDQDKYKAIANYEKFLELAPPDDSFRDDAQWIIEMLKKTKKEDLVLDSTSANRKSER